TRREELPKRAEQPRLALRECRYVLRAPQPLGVGTPARDAGGRARHVGEDAIVSGAVPPRRRLARIAARDTRCREPQALKVAADARSALHVDIERSELDVGELQDVGALSPGRRARVEHPLAAREVEAARGALRPRVL